MNKSTKTYPSELSRATATGDSIDELPDGIVLDLGMPRMDGHRTLQLLKADPIYMEIPVAIMTKPSGFWSMVELVQDLGEFAAGQPSFKDHLDSGDISDRWTL